MMSISRSSVSVRTVPLYPPFLRLKIPICAMICSLLGLQGERSACSRAPDEPTIAGFVGPQRDGARDDRRHRQRTEIAAIETVGLVPVPVKDLVVADAAAALPAW